MLTHSQFSVLNRILAAASEPMTQRKLAEAVGISLGKTNAVLAELKSAGLIQDSLRITAAGIAALEPYRVKNAVIMAAGMSTRFAPLSYEKPKALLEVRGELLIERQIRQLHEAGITEILLVVGYMKEKLFYLADKFGVEIFVNEDYYRFNNPSSLILVADRLDNTYLCSSDNYFTENPFEPYVYRAYYSAEYAPGETEEYCLTCNQKDRITHVTIGGSAAWFMIGHAYFDREFSRNFARILREEYAQPATKTQLWEDLYIRHLPELALYIRRYDSAVIKEFDSLDELRDFDSRYLNNSDSGIFHNICRVLGCREQDIQGIRPINTGLTNTSFRFDCCGVAYVYRHPGVGTEAYINRESEACSMQAAKELGLDDTFIFIDPKEGWKLSYFIEDAVMLDYHNPTQVEQALSLVRTLHGSGKTTPYPFDIWEKIRAFEDILQHAKRMDFEDAPAIREGISRLHRYADADGFEQCLCHCDTYDPNFLIDKAGKMYLIDWEYSGMSDPACDLGTFLTCADYSTKDAEEIVARYLQHAPTQRELRHYLAYAAVLSYYWFVWAIYQESVGKAVGSYLYLWYCHTKEYSARALSLYEAEN
ncbi:MAG: phosphotransferase [Oscillospiraceae bacterium]|nr:phosphotransferase [Oscillospiraceae bacterium]